MGVNFCPKTCGWVIVLIHRTSGFVIISIILPENEWFSFPLNKTYSNSVNFGSHLIVHSLEVGLFLSINGSVLVFG